MTKIALSAAELSQIHEQLKAASIEFDAVKKPLPDYSSVSEAMRAFRSQSKETKSLFTQYRVLFASDIDVFQLAYQKLVKADEDEARGYCQDSGTVNNACPAGEGGFR